MFSGQLPGTDPRTTKQRGHVPTTPPDIFHGLSPSQSLVSGTREAEKIQIWGYCIAKAGKKGTKKHGAAFRRFGGSYYSYSPITTGKKKVPWAMESYNAIKLQLSGMFQNNGVELDRNGGMDEAVLIISWWLLSQVMGTWRFFALFFPW